MSVSVPLVPFAYLLYTVLVVESELIDRPQIKMFISFLFCFGEKNPKRSIETMNKKIISNRRSSTTEIFS